MTGPSDEAVERARESVTNLFLRQTGNAFLLHGEIAAAAVRAAYPLIKADIEAALRTELADEIEAAGRKEVRWLSDTKTPGDRTDLGVIIGTEDGYKAAIRIVRGGEA